MNFSFSKIRSNKTLRNGTFFSLFSFFNRGINFILLILLANYIMPAEYGMLSLFGTLVVFLSYFIDSSTHGYVSISFFQSDEKDFKKDFSAICIITVAIFILISTLFIIFHNYLSNLLKLEPILLYIGIAISFFSVFVQLNLDYLRVQEKISLYGGISCSFAVLNMLLALYFVIKIKLNWHGYIYAQMICNSIFFLIAIIWFCKNHLLSFPKELKRYKTIILWGLPLIPHLASSWVRQGCDRYIINASHTTSDVGIFSFALNLTSIIIMIGTAFNATNSVDLYKVLSSDIDERSKKANLKKKEHIISVIYILSTIIIMLATITFVPIVLPNYTKSLPYFAILSVYGFMHCMYFLYCNYLFYFKQTKQLMYITFGTSIFHLILSLLFTRYSLYLTSIIYIISFTIMTLLVRKKARTIYNNLN